ncbi:MAG: hypothetical protein AAF846_23795 [Chloroflexota bacterium]
MAQLKFIGGLIAFIIFIGAGSVMMDRVLVPVSPYTDTLPVHSGCNTFLRGETPYSEDATLRTQRIILSYDREYRTEDDQHRFVYPAHHCLLLLPLWLTPYDMGVPVWMFLNFTLFLILPIAFLYFLTGYRVPLGKSVLLIVTSLFMWRYSMITVIFAQYTGWILFCFVGALWALKTKRSILLALFAVGLTVRSGGAVFAIAILLYALYEQRYISHLVFLSVMATLWVITLYMIGPWIPDFLDGLLNYTTYREDVAGWLPFRLGIIAGLLYALGMAITGISIMVRSWRENRETFILWGFTTFAILELVFLPQTNDYTLVYALPAIYLIAYSFRHNTIAFYLSVIVIALVPWVWSLWLSTLFEGRLDQLIMPAFILVMVVIAWVFGDEAIASDATAPTT